MKDLSKKYINFGKKLLMKIEDIMYISIVEELPLVSFDSKVEEIFL